MSRIDPSLLRIKADDRRYAATARRFERQKARWFSGGCQSPPRFTWTPRPRAAPAARKVSHRPAAPRARRSARRALAARAGPSADSDGDGPDPALTAAPPRLGFLFADASDVERIARLREMRVVVALLCGWGSPAKLAFYQALSGGSCAAALDELDRLPALKRRKVLACYAALMKGGR
jgi:hypothetical protein